MFRETGRGVFSVNKSTIIFYLILTTVTLFRSVPLKVTARGTATQETRVRDLNKEEILSTEITMKEDHRLFASNLIMRPEESFLNEVKPEDNNHVDKKQLKGYVLKSPEYPAGENVQNPTRHWAFRECLKNVREWSVRRSNFLPSPTSLPPKQIPDSVSLDQNSFSRNIFQHLPCSFASSYDPPCVVPRVEL